METLKIRLFGSPTIEKNGSIVEPGRRKVSALAAYLSATQAPQSRDGLAVLLWPEKDAKSSRAELRRSISSLRSLVGPEFLRVTGLNVSIDHGASVDVREFRALLSTVASHHGNEEELCEACIHALKRAVDLYKEDFLAGFTLSDSAAFDDWMIFEAERLRDLLGTALERLSRPRKTPAAEYLSEADRLDYAHRWLQLDRLNESAFRRLMNLYAVAGQRGAALRQYATCKKLLREELDTSPSRETEELRRRIEAGAMEAEPSEASTTAPGTVRPRRRRRIHIAAIAVAALLALGIGAGSWYLSRRAQMATGIPVAVLPLLDNSLDSENQWFAEGMTEAITTDLAKISSLRVTSRTSAAVAATGKPSIPEVRSSLGVDYVVEGSVLRAGDRVRVTAQLIDTKTDRHLWADEYESDLTGVIALQGRIAKEIANQVTAHVSPAEQRVLAQRRAVDPNAYEAYLLGAYQLSQLPFDVGAAEKSLTNLKRSIEMDASYAPAHAALANFYWGATQFGLYPPDEGMRLAKEAALKSVDLDESLADAHTVLGFIYFLADFDWRRSEQEFRRAIALKPSSAEAHCWYGSLLCSQGRFDQAIAEVNSALDIDPLSLINILNVAMRLYYSRDYDAAIKQATVARDMEEHFYMSHMVLGYALAASGSYQQAIEELETAASLAGDGAMEPLAVLSYVYNQAGQPTEAADAERRFEALGSKGMSLSPLLRAYIPLGRGDQEAALSLIEQAYSERDLNLAWNFQDPFFDPLRTHPRFVRLKKQLRL